MSWNRTNDLPLTGLMHYLLATVNTTPEQELRK